MQKKKVWTLGKLTVVKQNTKKTFKTFCGSLFITDRLSNELTARHKYNGVT